MNEKRWPEGLLGNADETFAFSPTIFIAWYSSQAFVTTIIPFSLTRVPFERRRYLISVFGH